MNAYIIFKNNAVEAVTQSYEVAQDIYWALVPIYGDDQIRIESTCLLSETPKWAVELNKKWDNI